MKGSFKLQNPNLLEASITLTATVEEWKRLRTLLPSDWPAWDVSALIRDLVLKAEAHLEMGGDGT